MISKYLFLSLAEESAICGKNTITHIPTLLSHSSFNISLLINCLVSGTYPNFSNLSKAYWTIPGASLGPWYSSTLLSPFPGAKTLIVGYPWIWYFDANFCWVVQSTFAIFTVPLNWVAAAVHSGNNFLQCPHHGA